MISTTMGSLNLPRNWDDTYGFHFGVRVRGQGPWTYYSGAAYDSSPVGSSDRTPDMPMDQQFRIAFGVQYDRDEKRRMGGAITFADYGKAKINNPILVGEYDDNFIVFASFNMSWR